MNFSEFPLYRHYKGGLYRLIAEAINETTMTAVMVYRAESNGVFWVRSAEEWNGTVRGEEFGRAIHIKRFDRIVEPPAAAP
jgi:hypothetical protein